MRLILENVGKVQEADIKLDGITLIAGENNTGKSTVGKMLFCIFESFYKIERQISQERINTIGRHIANFYHETFNRAGRKYSVHDLAAEFVHNKEQYVGDSRIIRKAIENFFENREINFDAIAYQDTLEQLADKIYSVLFIEDTEIRRAILQRTLDSEFGMKIGFLNNESNYSKIQLEIRNSKIEFEVINNENINIIQDMSLNKEIIYIDDPFVLDDLQDLLPYRSAYGLNHRDSLLDKIVRVKDTRDFGALDEILVNKKLERIFETMNGICDGDLTVSEDGGNYSYRTSELNGTLEMSNLSTGIKSFIILKTLLRNGSINDNGVVILDEPEIHLHPEWQLKFAEVIVLIQKEFGVNILLNTHSPYFLNAIEVYVKKYGIEKKCKFYLTDDNEGRTNIKDVTDQTELIYEKLARPLQDLENLEYSNGNTI
jgi:predicted ATPase